MSKSPKGSKKEKNGKKGKIDENKKPKIDKETTLEDKTRLGMINLQSHTLFTSLEKEIKELTKELAELRRLKELKDQNPEKNESELRVMYMLEVKKAEELENEVKGTNSSILLLFIRTVLQYYY